MQNAQGVVLEIQIKEVFSPLDISSATTKSIIIKKPSGAENTYSGSFVGTGQDGKIFYTTQSGDLNEAGVYQLQGYIVMPSFTGFSTITSFTVLENL